MNVLFAIIMVDTCHYMFVKTYKMYKTKSEPSGRRQTLGDDELTMEIYPRSTASHSGE